MFKPIPTLLCDFYKISHKDQYPKGTTLVYSNLTPRSGKYYKGKYDKVVFFGVGSYTYQYNTRDSQGWAMKATYCEINGKGKEIFKKPKTDSGKNSAKGLLKVEKGVLYESQTWEQEQIGDLKTVFKDGVLI